jgi:hypothetical protein
MASVKYISVIVPRLDLWKEEANILESDFISDADE